MDVIDYKKDPTYKAETTPKFINIPEMCFISSEGQGAPSGDDETEFQRAFQALYSVLYSIKFWDKKHEPPKGYAKFSATPPEGLWWTISGKEFDQNNTADWRWKLMIRVPEFVNPTLLINVIDELAEKKQSEVYRQVRLERFHEGMCVQILHVGPYDQEQISLEKMYTFANEAGYELVGKHHELYFGDPRRTAPEKLRTILRHPVQKLK